MTLSNRKTDEFYNDSKQQSRINNFNVVLNSNLVKDNKLICSWCELMGASGIETLSLVNDVLKPNGFIGIDLDSNNIADIKSKRPDLQWLSGNIWNFIPSLNDVGILNLDIYGNVGYEKDYRDLSRIKRLITKSVNEFGEFILFYNKDLDGVVRQGKKIGESLRYHTNQICDVFDEFLPNRKFNALTLLPSGSEKEIDNDFVGLIGAYEIYRGKSNGHRMANLRLIFR